jgi:bacterioferritin
LAAGKEEEHHINFLETHVDLITALGLQLYSSTHVGEPEA